MGTFVSGCSRNICLSSRGLNVLDGDGAPGGQSPAPLAFCVIGTVAGSGDLLLRRCHVA